MPTFDDIHSLLRQLIGLAEKGVDTGRLHTLINEQYTRDLRLYNRRLRRDNKHLLAPGYFTIYKGRIS